jgi:hypothetical protein
MKDETFSVQDLPFTDFHENFPINLRVIGLNLEAAQGIKRQVFKNFVKVPQAVDCSPIATIVEFLNR